VGAGNYPAKFSFDITTANCGNAAQPDFVVFNTSVATSGQASVVAYDNLYSGCATGTVPSTYWAYNTGGAVVPYDGSHCKSGLAEVESDHRRCDEYESGYD
jgi:hypothetical protein